MRISRNTNKIFLYGTAYSICSNNSFGDRQRFIQSIRLGKGTRLVFRSHGTVTEGSSSGESEA